MMQYYFAQGSTVLMIFPFSLFQVFPILTVFENRIELIEK